MPSTELYWWVLVVYPTCTTVKCRQIAWCLGGLYQLFKVLLRAIPDKLANLRVALCMAQNLHPLDVKGGDTDVNDFWCWSPKYFFENAFQCYEYGKCWRTKTNLPVIYSLWAIFTNTWRIWWLCRTKRHFHYIIWSVVTTRTVDQIRTFLGWSSGFEIDACSTNSSDSGTVTLLKPTGNYTYNKLWHSKILHCDHTEFVSFVWIWEQTANFALQNFKWLVFIAEVESVYSAVRIDSL